MRAVVDASVLIRSLIRPQGSAGPVLSLLRDNAYTLVYSEPLLEELIDVLTRPRIRERQRISEEDVKTLLQLILMRGEAVVPQRAISVCRDPEDNKVLEAAIAGKAEAIVSSDQDLLVLGQFEGIPIVDAAAFLTMLARA